MSSSNSRSFDPDTNYDNTLFRQILDGDRYWSNKYKRPTSGAFISRDSDNYKLSTDDASKFTAKQAYEFAISKFGFISKGSAALLQSSVLQADANLVITSNPTVVNGYQNEAHTIIDFNGLQSKSTSFIEGIARKLAKAAVPVYPLQNFT